MVHLFPTTNGMNVHSIYIAETHLSRTLLRAMHRFEKRHEESVMIDEKSQGATVGRALPGFLPECHDESARNSGQRKTH
jgi:hypothetical protein